VSARWTLTPTGHGQKKNTNNTETPMSTNTLLLLILILLLVGALPVYPYSRGWGYYPSGLLGIVLVVILVLALL
jgi:hypothetical protein